MDKSILFLVAVGIALSILHVPDVAIALGLITSLAIVTIKLFWVLLQPFFQSSPQPRKVPVLRS